VAGPGALSAGTVSLAVRPDGSDFGRRLADSIKGQGSALSTIGKGVGLAVAAGVAGAVAGIGLIIKTGIDEAKDASAGIAQLEAGIKSTGGVAGTSVKGMTDLAGSIQALSGQTDDSIVASENLLLTFVNIKNVGPNKIFDQATLASANMAAKMGGDASGMAIKLGRALNDPTKGIMALTRVGVQFTQGQKDSIKAMQEHGDMAGAQGVILKELETEFGGAAKAAGESMPGQLARGKRAFEDLSQTVVEKILPVIMPTITRIADKIRESIPGIIEFAQAFSEKLHAAIVALTPVAEHVWAAFIKIKDVVINDVIPGIQSLWKWVQDNKTMLEGFGVMILAAVVAFQAYNAVMTVIKVATIAWTIVQGILNGTLIANPIGLVVMAVAALVAGIIWVATKTTFFQDVWASVWGGVTAAFNAARDWILSGIGTIVGTVESLPGRIRGAASGMWDGIRDSFKSAINWVLRAWNDFQFTIGGGNIMGVDIPKITLDTPNIPLLAQGATVMPTPGGTVVRVAEAVKPESVVDTGKLNNLMDRKGNDGPLALDDRTITKLATVLAGFTGGVFRAQLGRGA
jgi:hypothetical protein